MSAPARLGSERNSCINSTATDGEKTPLVYRPSGEQLGRFDGDSCDPYMMGTGRRPPVFDRSFALTCIVIHECLHSAAFYMIVPGLLYFVRKPQMLTYDWAVIVTLIFAGVAFCLPLIGGIIGDTVMGRYTAVLFGTVIELIGMVILFIYSVIMYIHQNKEMQKSLLPMLVISLVLVALGMGFIKANVNPFGASQLQQAGGSVETIQSYFRWYTFAINFGKLLAFFPVAFLLKIPEQTNCTTTTISPTTMFTTPTPRFTTTLYNTTWSDNQTTEAYFSDLESEPEPDYNAIIATGIQVVFVGVAIFIFMIGKTKYKRLPPIGGAHMNYIFCFYRRRFNPVLYHEHHEYIAKMEKYQKMVLRITFITAALFAMFVIYEAIYFQLLSTFMLQASTLAKPCENCLPLPFMNTFQNAFIIISIPLLERLWNSKEREYVTKDEIEAEVAKRGTVERINKAFSAADQHQSTSILQTRQRSETGSREGIEEKEAVSDEIKQQIGVEIGRRKRRRTLMIRMCIGMVLAALAALAAGVLETIRKNREAHSESAPSLFWQLPQYLLMGIAEVFGVISAYEFAYTESFPGVQGFTTGMFISSYGLGSFVALFIFLGVSKNGSTDLCPDKEHLSDMNLDYSYYGLCGAMLFVSILFYILGREYRCKSREQLTEPERPAGFSDPDELDDI